MNNNLIRNTSPINLPFLPPLSGAKTTRVITKHFTNCSLYMSGDHLSLLTWLIYQSRNDNTIHYTTHLLSKYRGAVLMAGGEYKVDIGLYKSVPLIRRGFKELIEMGYLLPNYPADIFTINPMLTYRDEYIRKDEYRDLVSLYQSVQFGTSGDVREIGKFLSDTVNKRIKDKKISKRDD